MADSETRGAAHSTVSDADHAVLDDEEAAQARAAEAERVEAARRTAVVRVGEAEDQGDDEPRRGWWQKLVT